MDAQLQESAYRYYDTVISELSDRFPAVRESGAGMLMVMHAFNDKIPLVQALLDHDLLLGGVLKRSSSQEQPAIADKLTSMLQDDDLFMNRADRTHAVSAPVISRAAGERPFIIADHGGHFTQSLSKLSDALGPQLVGVTEHTLNGEQRVKAVPESQALQIPYLSAARSDLKERSDREISASIAQEVIDSAYDLGHDLEDANKTILLIGYGTMGMHIVKALRALGCEAEIIVNDNSAKKRVFAMQDGQRVSESLDNALPRADVVILATNVIKGMVPVLTEHEFALLKRGAAIASVTSMDDEVDFRRLQKNGSIFNIGTEAGHAVYEVENGSRFSVIHGGKPANVVRPDGGVKEAMFLHEAAMLAAVFALADAQARRETLPDVISDEVAEILAKPWIAEFGQKERPGLVSGPRAGFF